LLFCNSVSHRVMHNPHSCNLAAHSLAALGADLSPDTVSVRDNISHCTQVLVAEDLAAVDS